MSNGCTGLGFSSSIGVYTFTNGTTTNDTKLLAIIEDIWSLKPTADDKTRRWANHTLMLAQLALDEANEVLYQGPASLICQNQTTNQSTTQTTAVSSPENSGILHDEFRRLQASGWSYLTATIGTAALGAGLGAAIGVTANHVFTGNISAMNVVQTAAVVGSTILLSGIVNRQHEVGRLDRGAAAMQRGVARVGNRGREILTQNILIGYLRSITDEIKRREARQALAVAQEALGQQTGPLSQAGADVSGFSDLGSLSLDNNYGLSAAGGSGEHTPGGSVGPGTPKGTPPRKSGNFICLADESAADALGGLSIMSDEDIRLKTMEYMETIQEYTLSGNLEDMEQGLAGPAGQSSCDWASFEIGSQSARTIDSADIAESSAMGSNKGKNP